MNNLNAIYFEADYAQVMTVLFRPLNAADFELLDKWLAEPHVKSVWDDDSYTESYEKYLFRIGDDSVHQFILQLDAELIGYFQHYWASKVGGGWWSGIDDQTVGIDFYIGEPSYLSKGIGYKILEAAKELIFQNSIVERIIADPAPSNGKIIHLLKKAGFIGEREIDTPDGRARMMSVERKAF